MMEKRVPIKFKPLYMHQKNDKSLAEAGVFAHVVALDSNAPIETVRHIHGIAHA